MNSIYIDTNILILAFERPNAEGAYIWPVLDAVEAGEFVAKTSQITLSEVLIRPLRLGQTDLAETYESLFRSKSIFDSLPVTMDILVEAARARAGRISIKLPDAIHIATARLSACAAFLTADKDLLSLDPLMMIPPSSTCLADLRSRLA